MKDKLWRVRYKTGFMKVPLSRRFTTEHLARSFYRRTWKMPYFQTASIFHLIEDNVKLIVARVTSVMDRPAFQKLWKKIPKREQKKIREAQAKAVRNILEEVVK